MDEGGVESKTSFLFVSKYYLFKMHVEAVVVLSFRLKMSNVRIDFYIFLTSSRFMIFRFSYSSSMRMGMVYSLSFYVRVAILR